MHTQYSTELAKNLLEDIVTISREITTETRELNRKFSLRGRWISELAQALPFGMNTHRKIAKLFKKNGLNMSYASVFAAQKKWGVKKKK